MRANQIRQIRQVLAIFIAAFLTAGLVAGYMLYRYNPKGYYLAGNALLAPDVLDKLSYSDFSHQTGAKSKFVFNGIEFSYFDKIKGKIVSVRVSSVDYATFYQWIISDKSVSDVDEETIRSFHPNDPTLILTVRPDHSALVAAQVFQIVQLAENDYFRVQLHENQGGEPWAYFYHPHIYQDTLHLFNLK